MTKDWSKVWKLSHDLYYELEELRNPNEPLKEPEYEEGQCYIVENCGIREVWKRGYNFWRYFGSDSANIIADHDDRHAGKYKIIRKIDMED